METQFSLALARLDAEIMETEARLQDLRLRRKGAQAFLEYMEDGVVPTRPTGGQPSTTAPAPEVREARASTSGGSAVAVMDVFKRTPDVVLGIDDVHKEAAKDGHTFTRIQIRNSLHYATRQGWISKAGRRGSWILRNASAPAVTGAEETEVSTSDSSIQEGGSDHGSEFLRGRAESASGSQTLHDHAGYRTSIDGGSD